MDKVIGGILGLMAFVAVIMAGIVSGLTVEDTIVRAGVAGLVGFFVGWLLFGKVGMGLAKEAAGPIELSKSDSKAGNGKKENENVLPEDSTTSET